MADRNDEWSWKFVKPVFFNPRTWIQRVVCVVCTRYKDMTRYTVAHITSQPSSATPPPGCDTRPPQCSKQAVVLNAAIALTMIIPYIIPFGVLVPLLPYAKPQYVYPFMSSAANIFGGVPTSMMANVDTFPPAVLDFLMISFTIVLGVRFGL